jgi:DNA modification methylase
MKGSAAKLPASRLGQLEPDDFCSRVAANHSPWSAEEDAYLTEEWLKPDTRGRAIAQHLGRSPDAVTARAAQVLKLGVKPKYATAEMAARDAARAGHPDNRTFCHPSQKPIEVMEWCVRSLPADARVICDPFMGSATTGVACVRLDRQFIGIEREPTYFDTACRRIEEAYRQPRLFDEPAPKPVQTSIFGDAA